jgi:hypothetical protein
MRVRIGRAERPTGVVAAKDPEPAMPPITSVVLAAALFPAVAAAAVPSAGACEAHGAAQPPALVELYTSEGCSSCPPADRWLSALKGRSDVIALAFHVNYWDRLGWPDRFATPAITERQHQRAQASGSSTVYTPQVVLNGRDWRQWGGTTLARLPPSPVALALRRDGNTVTARIGGGSARLAGYWAVLEDGHSSRVRAGENAGETLQHDHVVTWYQPVAAWSARDAATQLTLTLPAPMGGSARRVAFVVTDAASQRPLQALALGC